MRTLSKIIAPAGARCRESGYALVSVVWLLGLLAAAAASMSLYSVNSLSVVNSSADRAVAEGLTRAGLELAALDLSRADPRALARGVSVARLGNGVARAAWRGETGRIDINVAAPELLAGLFRRFGASSMDADLYASQIARRRGTAIAQGGFGPFAHVVELEGIGAPGALIHRIEPFVTVYSGSPRIDPRLAARDTLAALPGMSEARLRSLMSLRARDEPDFARWSSEAGEASRYLSFDKSQIVRVLIDTAQNNGFKSLSEIIFARYPDDTEPYRTLAWTDWPEIADSNFAESDDP